MGVGRATGQWLRVEGVVLGVGKTLAGIITLLKVEFYGLLRGNNRFSARHAVGEGRK